MVASVMIERAQGHGDMAPDAQPLATANQRIVELGEAASETIVPRATMPGDAETSSGYGLPDGSRVACETAESLVVVKGLWTVHHFMVGSMAILPSSGKRSEPRNDQQRYGNPNGPAVILAGMLGEFPTPPSPTDKEVSLTWRMCDVVQAAASIVRDAPFSASISSIETPGARTILQNTDLGEMNKHIIRRWGAVTPLSMPTEEKLAEHLLKLQSTDPSAAVVAKCPKGFGCDKLVTESGVFGLVVVPALAAYLGLKTK